MRISKTFITLILSLLLTGSAFAHERHRSASPSLQTLEIEGIVKSASASELVVTDSHQQDVTVEITSQTMFRSGDTAISSTDLAAGDRVEVKAINANNVLSAVVVDLQSTNQEPQLVEINGVIKSVSSSELVVTDAHGTDTTIAIDSNTQIFKDDQVATVGDLAVGDRVEVKASVSGTTLTAVVINAESPDTANQTVEINGTVSAVGSNQITVTTKNGDVVVAIDSNTQILKDGQPATLADITGGERVEIEASVSNGTTTALIINIESADNAEVDVNGTVSAVGSTSITVTTRNGDVTVNVDSNTKITKDDQTIALGDIHVGDQVEAQGTSVDAHTILATQIEVNGGSGHH